MHLMTDSHLMDNVKDIFFDCFKIRHLQIAHLSEHFELIKFIDQPSHDKNESLNFTSELISKVYLVFVVVKSGAILSGFLLQQLELLCLFFEHFDDINFIVHSCLIFLRLYILLVSLSKLLSKEKADYVNWMVVIQHDMAFHHLQNFLLNIIHVLFDGSFLNLRSFLIQILSLLLLRGKAFNQAFKLILKVRSLLKKVIWSYNVFSLEII